MKKIIITAAVLFLGTNIFAQKTETANSPMNEISINAGAAIPMSNFAKGDYANDKSGFAKGGFHLNLSGTHQLKKNWGINVVVGYSQFGSKGLQSLVEGYKEDSGTDSTTLTTLNKSSSFNILVGPVYKISVSDKFSVQLRSLVGYTTTTLAGFNLYYEDYLAKTIMTQKTAIAGGLGVQIGAGANYKITDKFSILANVDYFTSKPKFNVEYENYNVNAGRKIDTYKENISGVNATVGVGFSF